MSKASILAGFKTDFQAGISTIKNTTIDDTGFLALPQGTTAQRVGIATTQGMIRYNTTTNKVEGYYEPGSNWKPINLGAGDKLETQASANDDVDVFASILEIT